MSAGVKDVALVPQESAVSADLVLMFERLAKDPAVDADKLEKLVTLQERILARNAESEFNAAFVAMQRALPVIDEHGIIRDNNGQERSRYAKWEDIKAAITPILATHGFSLRHRVEFPTEASVKVTAYLTHDAGHSVTSEFLAKADTSGSKNAIQALGSSTSYGRRYTAIDVTGITSREPERRDDDGRGSDAARKPETPEAVTELLKRLALAAGTDQFYPTWNQADAKARQFVTKHHADTWTDLKAAHAAGGRS